MYSSSTKSSCAPIESTSFMCLSPIPISDDTTPQCVSPSSTLIHFTPPLSTLDSPPLPTPSRPLVNNSPPNLLASPPRHPPITRVYTRHLKPPIPTSSTSPNAPNIDDSTNSDESCATSDEIQDGPQYNL